MPLDDLLRLFTTDQLGILPALVYFVRGFVRSADRILIALFFREANAIT